MSASKDRLNRKQQIEAGTDKHTLARQQEEKARRHSTARYIIIGVAIILVFAFIFLYNSAWPSRHLTAVNINGEKYSVAQLNYYYSSSYQSFYNNYYYYFAMGYGPFSTDESLADQQYAEGESWRDYFLQSAVDSMTQIQMLNAEAEAAGYTMSDDEQTSYQTSCQSLETSWSDNGYSSLQQFLNLNYGKGVTIELAEREMYRTLLASSYSQYLYDGYDYTTEDLDSYYAEHADEYDVISYTYYLLSESTYESDTVTADDAAKLAADDAAKIVDAVKGTDEDSFNAYLSENFNGASSTADSYAGSSLSDVYSAWLLDAGRKAGDVSSFDSDGSQYVVMFLSRDNNDYQLVNFRHILIKAVDTDGDSTYSDEEFATAHDQAEAYLTEWKSGAADEDSFAEMANLYSEDTGSNTTGGLYENVYKGQMVTPVNDWLFDATRQPGDVAVVDYNEGGSYTGAHVVYFVGYADLTYAQYQADQALRTDAYNTWKDGQLANYTATTSNLKLCGQNH